MLTQLPLVPVLMCSKAAADAFHIAWGAPCLPPEPLPCFDALASACPPSLIFRAAPPVALGSE